MEQTIYRDALFVVRVLNSCKTLEQVYNVDNLITNFVKIHPEADRSLCLSLQKEYNRKKENLRRKFWKESDKKFDELLEGFHELFKEVLEK